MEYIMDLLYIPVYTDFLPFTLTYLSRLIDLLWKKRRYIIYIANQSTENKR